MRILFVHQNFPGQYLHIARALANQKCHQLVSLSIEEPEYHIAGVTQLRYGVKRGNQPGIHPWLLDLETKIIRGEACAHAAIKLRKDGFTPDLICAHPGWGEMLFLRDIWKSASILSYQEFYYNVHGYDFDFDPEFQNTPTWQDSARIRIKQVNQELNLGLSNWCVTPTEFQRSSFPHSVRQKISVIHDGIDISKIVPKKTSKTLELPDGTMIKEDDELITFVNRRLEPYRGFHSFARAIPTILDSHPKARVAIIGKTSGVSYGSPCPSGEWKDFFMNEISGKYDHKRVHFTESIPHDHFIALMQRSNAHVYLTYPFVLSWSLLEAMACGSSVIGSRTQPVMEVIQNEVNGLLVDFFSPDAIAEAVSKLLLDRKLAMSLGSKARHTIESTYSLQRCLNKHLSLMSLVASGAVDSLAE